MDIGLILLLAFPLIWPVIAWKIWESEITINEMLCNIGIVVVLVTGVWYAGKYRDMLDFQIYNGQIIDKKREHGTYIESYSCNCFTTCSGSSKSRTCSTHCQTCHRTHYTVDWFAHTTVGNVTFSRADWTSSGVYLLPDPQSYKDCQPEQPVSLEKNYTNYIKAVPESLFHLNPALTSYKDKIPAYPRVHDFYKINRVIQVGSNVDADKLNDYLNNTLRFIGPKKEANIVVILTSINDPMYKYAVENAWLAGKKNDVIIYIGLEGEKITWADATLWVKNKGNELTAVHLRDSLMGIGSYDVEKIGSEISNTILAEYKRPHMKDYEYLLDEIDPPLWAIILATLMSIFGTLGLTWFFHKNDVF